MKYILILFLIISLSSCKKKSMYWTIPEPDTHDTGAWLYYPLSLGNQWHYKIDSLRLSDSAVIKTLGWQFKEINHYDETNSEYTMITNNRQYGGTSIWDQPSDTIYNYLNFIVLNRIPIINTKALDGNSHWNTIWSSSNKSVDVFGQLVDIKTSLGSFKAMMTNTQNAVGTGTTINSYYVNGIGLVREEILEGVSLPLNEQKFYARTLYKYFVIRY